jgi:hypothetical protein
MPRQSARLFSSTDFDFQIYASYLSALDKAVRLAEQFPAE